MADFRYSPSHHVPFRDEAALEAARKITREDFLNHPNKNLDVQVMKDFDVWFFFMMDIYFRIKEAMEAGERLVMILPQPWPLYEKVAYMLNRDKVDCRNLYTFNMDEYANEDGEIAPETWPYGFTHALKEYFYSKLDPAIRPPENQMIGLTNETFKDYGKRIADLGGADICYSGPGWTGHLAFVEPDASRGPQGPRGVQADGPQHRHAQPLHAGPELPARQLRFQRRHRDRPAESGPPSARRSSSRRRTASACTASASTGRPRPGNASLPVWPSSVRSRPLGPRFDHPVGTVPGMGFGDDCANRSRSIGTRDIDRN